MDEKERLIYFYYERFQGIRRAQRRYFALLLGLLGFVWVFYWNRPSGSHPSLFGMPLSDKNLLGVTPALATILLLGFIGALRALEPALHALREAWSQAGGTAARLEMRAIDTHPNWVDYAMWVWARPFDYLVHAGVFVAVIASTLASGLTLGQAFKGFETLLFTTYCLLCVGVQGAACWKWLMERIALSRRKGYVSAQV